MYAHTYTYTLRRTSVEDVLESRTCKVHGASVYCPACRNITAGFYMCALNHLSMHLCLVPHPETKAPFVTKLQNLLERTQRGETHCILWFPKSS